MRLQTKEIRESVALMDATGYRAEHIHAPEDAEIAELCDRIGYGAVMDAAARLWFRKDPIGAFVVGPCAATTRALQALVGTKSIYQASVLPSSAPDQETRK